MQLYTSFTFLPLWPEYKTIEMIRWSKEAEAQRALARIATQTPTTTLLSKQDDEAKHASKNAKTVGALAFTML